MKHTITLIPGDGIGPEITAATVRVIEATGVEIIWETQILGSQALEKYGGGTCLRRQSNRCGRQRSLSKGR